jgi:catechol 2,3-dioxygenase-like lactoylglutathione lyase family enzyme
MSLAHLTLPTQAVERTARFFEQMLAYTRDTAPANSPMETVWLATGGGQQMHIIYVEGFEVSPFEGEFGRHIAIFHPAGDIAALKERLQGAGTHLMQPMRPSGQERFFFRDPINGYVFEVIAHA